MDGQKIGSIFRKAHFHVAHHLISFVMNFLVVGYIFVGKRCGGKSGLSVLFIPC
jgi:hypothetical protein